MAKRAGGKDSVGWKPDGIEILNVEPLFPDEKIEALARHLLKDLGDLDMASFRVGVLNAAGIYRLNLHYDLGPRGSERHKVLADMLCQAKALERVIEALDLHSRKALEAAAGEDPRDPGLEPENLPDPGRTRVRCAVASLEHLQRWAETALRNTKPSPRGRTRQDAEREVVEMLKAVWEKHSSARPTLIAPKNEEKHSQFLEFCRGTLWPISDLYGVERSDLTTVVQDVLYSSK